MTFQPKQAFGLDIKLRTATGTDAVKASHSFGSGNAALHFVAKAAGVTGNGISVALIDPGTNHTLSVAVAGTAITVTLGYSSSAIDSAANAVIAAIYETAAAAALVDVDNGAGTGVGTVVAAALANLTAGADATHTFESIPGIGDTEVPGLGRTALEFTSHSSEDGYEEFMKSIVKAGRTMTLPLMFDPENAIHQALQDAEASDDASIMQFVFTYGDGASDFESDVLVLSIPLSNPVKGLISTSVELQLTGAPRVIA